MAKLDCIISQSNCQSVDHLFCGLESKITIFNKKPKKTKKVETKNPSHFSFFFSSDFRQQSIKFRFVGFHFLSLLRIGSIIN